MDKLRWDVVPGPQGSEISNVTYANVKTHAQVLDYLKRGGKNRHVRGTKMNAESSRSHLVLSVFVEAHNTVLNKETFAKLHLIDLAGSERVDRSGVTGEALKEAISINKSLNALGNCIELRAQKSKVNRYAESQLTKLLKDSLESNSKTLMFVNLSPLQQDASETISTLNFGSRVRQVEVGKAKANVKKSSRRS